MVSGRSDTAPERRIRFVEAVVILREKSGDNENKLVHNWTSV